MKKLLLMIVGILTTAQAVETGCNEGWPPVIVGSDPDYSQILIWNCTPEKFDDALNEMREFMLRDDMADVYNLKHYVRGNWYLLCEGRTSAHFVSMDRFDEKHSLKCLAMD